MNDAREFAALLLRIGAWANMAGGVFFAVFFLIDESGPLAGGALIGGLLGWALCFSVAAVSDESREVHHIIDKLTRG